jgi:hypothetical protein
MHIHLRYSYADHLRIRDTVLLHAQTAKTANSSVRHFVRRASVWRSLASFSNLRPAAEKCLAAGSYVGRNLEQRFESELILPGSVVRIGCRNLSEGRVTERIA